MRGGRMRLQLRHVYWNFQILPGNDSQLGLHRYFGMHLQYVHFTVLGLALHLQSDAQQYRVFHTRLYLGASQLLGGTFRLRPFHD